MPDRADNVPKDAPPSADEAPSHMGVGGDRAVHPSAFEPRPGRRGAGRWILVSSVVVGVGLLGSLFAFGLGRDPSAIRSPLLGRPAPDFALPELDGAGVIRLSALRGNVVVVNFWASWCAACRDEHAGLLSIWERFRDKGMVLVGVDFQDRKPAALAFMREMGGDWPVVEDPGGGTALGYGVYGIPETFFIGRDGTIRFKQIGPSSYEQLTNLVQRLLRERGGRHADDVTVGSPDKQ